MNHEYIFGHKLVLITYRRKFVTFNTMSDPDYGSAPYYIKHEGVYMFGGVLGKNAGCQKLTNKLFYLPIGQPINPRWKELETKGSPPEPRFYHEMHFYEKGNILIILAGKKFTFSEPSIKKQGEFVN
jgi:hypothetical protein